jgi:hypothetical protein
VPAQDTQLLIVHQPTGIKSMDSMSDPKFGAELKGKIGSQSLRRRNLGNNIKELFPLDQALIPKLTEILK